MGFDFIADVLLLFGILFLVVLIFILSVNVIETALLSFRLLRRCGSAAFRSFFFWEFMNHKHFAFLNLIKWLLYDLFTGKDYFKLFGIWAFTGYYGEGKSLGAVTYAFELQAKYPAMNIKIYSNFHVQGQTGQILKWEDMLELPPNTILIFDEIQSTFASTKFKDFPIELLWKLTQCRKHGLAIFCTTPVYSRMTIQLRESTDFVIDCKNLWSLDRYFIYTFYRAPDYEKKEMLAGMFTNLKQKQLVAFQRSVVARNIDYARYDTKEQIDRFDVVGEDAPKATGKVNLKKIEDDVYKRVMAEVERRGGLRSA